MWRRETENKVNRRGSREEGSVKCPWRNTLMVKYWVTRETVGTRKGDD